MSTDPAPTETSTAHTSASRRAIVGVGVFLLLLLAFVSPAAEQGLLGWLYFPASVLPRVTADGPSATVGLVAIVLFVVSLHFTLGWFVSGRPWPVRLTLSIALLLGLLFDAGTAMVGATHQVVWLLTDGGPFAPPRSTAGFLCAVQSARSAARISQFKNNAHQLGLAIHNVHDSYGALPPGGTMNRQGRLLHGWAIFLGNYASYSSHGIDFSVPWNEPPNDRLYRCALPDFQHPSARQQFDAEGYGLAHIAGNQHVLRLIQVDGLPKRVGDFAKLDGERPLTLKDVTDGVSQTILAGEVARNFRPWGHPCNLRDPSPGIGKSPDGFDGQPDEAGAHMLFADGSVRLLGRDTDPQVTRAFAIPDDGLPVD